MSSTKEIIARAKARKAALASEREAAEALLDRVQDSLDRQEYREYVESNWEVFNGLYAADPEERSLDDFAEAGFQEWKGRRLSGR